MGKGVKKERFHRSLLHLSTFQYRERPNSGDKHTKDGGRLYKCEKIPIRTTIYPLTCWKVEGTFASEKVLRNGKLKIEN